MFSRKNGKNNTGWSRPGAEVLIESVMAILTLFSVIEMFSSFISEKVCTLCAVQSANKITNFFVIFSMLNSKFGYQLDI